LGQLFYSGGNGPPFSDYEVLAKAVAFLLAVVNSFVLNSWWTFREEVAASKGLGRGFWDAKRGAKFFLTAFTGLGINSLVFTLVRESSALLPDFYSRILALVFATAVVLVWNFLVNLKWTYR